MDRNFKYIYGPVHSWRLGVSLGIDPVSRKQKICNFDCVYCQLGKTDIFCNERKVYVPAADIVDEVNAFPAGKIDYLTFSGRGEPTLAKNLGEMIRRLKANRKEKVAVITNGALIDKEDVQEYLLSADFVLIKLDAIDQESLTTINGAMDKIRFSRIVEGLKAFRKKFKKRLALQIMFINGNKEYGKQMAGISKEINADEIEINTPLRPSSVKPLSPEELQGIKTFFKGQPARTVYELNRKTIDPVNEEETIKRHGKFREQ